MLLAAIYLRAWDPAVRPAVAGGAEAAAGTRRGVVEWRAWAVPPPCPTWWLGGVYCGGCGTLRAWHHALHGRLGAAMSHNAVSLVVGGAMGAWLGAGLLGVVIRGRWWGPRALDQSGRSRRVLWVIVWIVLGWSVIRNMPVRWLDWSRPPAPAWLAREARG
jgi:hypothetical protein